MSEQNRIKLYTKDELICAIKQIASRGWHKSIKETRNTRNDGAVGNTLESLLGITENNLPIPNAREWELKGQRAGSASLITLKHIEPSPQAAYIVSSILLPKYGWTHKKAGTSYPVSEMSFRSTTSANCYTKRGFRIIVDRAEKKLKFIFDANKVDLEDSEVKAWITSVKSRIGLGAISPEPYWGFEDLKYSIGEKIKNCFYVIADAKVENRHEYFSYQHLLVLSGFSFDKFLTCVERGNLLVDFDARTGHNHGTKFRIKQGVWSELYDDVKTIL
jgi:hypothetical protein